MRRSATDVNTWEQRSLFVPELIHVRYDVTIDTTRRQIDFSVESSDGYCGDRRSIWTMPSVPTQQFLRAESEALHRMQSLLEEYVDPF